MAEDIDQDEREANRYRAACKNEAPILGRFYDWLIEEGLIDLIQSDDTRRPEQLIAGFLGINLDAVERHRRRVIADLQRAPGEPDS